MNLAEIDPFKVKKKEHLILFIFFSVPPVTSYVQPSCNLPTNLTGTWYHVGEYDSDVIINDTHIYFKTKFDEFSYEEQYFSCQQTLGTRYLMTKITVGKWFVNKTLTLTNIFTKVK